MDVIVVGGGAAGMMAAIESSKAGAKVSLYEKNEKLGKKLYITGKGRCNVTNSSDMETIFSNINSNPKFLYSALYAFDNSAVMNFFEELGCHLKVERGNRVFPVSDHSSDIIKALESSLRKNNVDIHLNTKVSRILARDDSVIGIEISGGKKIYADKVILATGGLSYPTTGSDGDGYRFAGDYGHTIVKTCPSLIPLVSHEEWVKSLQGLSLKNVEFRLVSKGKKVYSELGEMLFTHFGISGPIVLSASSVYQKEIEKGHEIRAFLDLKPGLSPEMLDKRILRDFETVQNKNFSNALDDLLPKRFIPVIIEKSGISPDIKVNSVSKEQRSQLVSVLKNLEIEISGTRPIDEAIITRGGINVKEINPSTMESKLMKNLFFAGEMIDVDAMTGGYNLQIAWSTGYLAGQSCME